MLTKYIGRISEAVSDGEWVIDNENEGTPEHPIRMPYVNYDELVDLFVTEFYQFAASHPEYRLTNYDSILENNGLKWDDVSMRNVNVDTLDEQCALALIMGAIRAERFCDGALLSFFKNGSILKWLKRLKALDSDNVSAPIEGIYFKIGGYSGYDTYRITVNKNSVTLITTLWCEEPIEKHYSPEERRMLLDAFEDLHVEYWNSEYIDPCICDGTQWELAVKYEGHRGKVWVGSNAYPSNWEELLSFFEIKHEEGKEE